jgi:AcrR family transcriptional regulator
MAFTARSQATRSAILGAARELLVNKGYEATTIRAVAAKAGIDPSMVMRYYGSKEGLFAAAVDLDLQLPDPSEWPREEIGQRLASYMVARWDRELSHEPVTLLLRSAGTNPAAAEQLRLVFAGQIVRLVRAVTGESDQDAARRAGLLATQVLGFALCRYVLELPPILEMDVETLARALAPVIRHYLFGDLAATD